MVARADKIAASGKKRRTVSLKLLMVAGFGGLMALAVGGVLAMSIYANFTNTFSFLNRQAIQLINRMERSIERDAQEAERVVRGLAQLYTAGEFEIGVPASQNSILMTLLLTERVVEHIEIVDKDGKRTGLARRPNNEIVTIDTAPQPSDTPNGNADALPLAATHDPVWNTPTMHRGHLFHTVSEALIRHQKTQGIAVAAVGAYSLNRIVSEIGRDNDTTALIVNADQEIIAYSRDPELFRDNPTIAIATFPDDAIKAYAAELNGTEEEHSRTIADNLQISSVTTEDGNDYIFLSREITTMSTRAYTLIAYFDAADVGSELRRALMAAVFGVLAFFLAVILAIVFGNRLSNPLMRIAASAKRFADLDLNSYAPLPKSRVREIDEQAGAMNSMHTALTQFGQYVPKELVRRLMQTGTEATRSVEWDITVMFTDVVGFTSMSEQLSAGDVVKMLNEHFELLCSQIESRQGTVDKFLGDGLMAFWGAPEADSDHASNAIEAARQIAASFQEDNLRRVKNGQPPLRLRIGIHTGSAVIGNIGSHDRHNYTVIGDIVNVASRLEQLGKELIEDDDIIILASADCRTAAGNPAHMTHAGSHELRGRRQPIDVFRLMTDKE